MSLDMRDYSGELDPAAVDQTTFDSNSYLQETSEDQLISADSSQESEAPVDHNPQAENFRALRDEVERMRAERDSEKRDYQAQLDLLRANMAPKAQEPQQRKFLDGLKDDDIPSVAELRKEFEQRESNYQNRIEELQVAQAHPDYAEVIEKYAIPLVKQKPHLAEGIQGASNKALFAYELGKMAQAMQQSTTAPAVSENAQRIVQNAKKPGTLSQAGGQGALSKADYIASMSDAEFYQYASKNLERI